MLWYSSFLIKKEDPVKGMILAGGQGTRLHPTTQLISKQLLPVYDKPMIYYPLTTLMLAGLRDILVITTPRDQSLFYQLLGDGSKWGISLHYAVQLEPRGIAQAFLVGEKFIGNSSICLILGDNVLYGEGLGTRLSQAAELNKGATLFAYYVQDPENYGVIQFDTKMQPIDILEKPKAAPPSHYAVIGLYFYNHDVVELARHLKPSLRGELEITDINRLYLQKDNLIVHPLGRGIAWLDTGTPDSLLDAAHFFQVLERRQSRKVSFP